MTDEQVIYTLSFIGGLIVVFLIFVSWVMVRFREFTFKGFFFIIGYCGSDFILRMNGKGVKIFKKESDE